MRITAVTTWFPTATAPSRGSFVARDLHAIGRLHSTRVVHLVAPYDDDGTRRLRYEGIDVCRIPMNPADPLSVVRAAHALPEALRGAQIVHSMAFSALEPLALSRPQVPWAHTEHWSALTNPHTLSRVQRFTLPALTRLLALPDVVTTVCEYLARPVRGARGSRPTRIVPCVVDPYVPSPRRPRDDGSLRLVSVGGLIERKDPLLAVEILAELRRRGVDARLEWVGDGPLRDQTGALAEDFGIGEFLLLAGTKDSAGVRDAFARADLFLGPTNGDNFFVSAAESVIAGRPVVVGASGGHDEYLFPSTSRLVTGRSAPEWADAVLDMDRAAAATPAEEIAATIGDAFSSEVVGAAYNAVYRELLAPAGGWDV